MQFLKILVNVIVGLLGVALVPLGIVGGVLLLRRDQDLILFNPETEAIPAIDPAETANALNVKKEVRQVELQSLVENAHQLSRA